ncbi:N-acetylglucosamine kinase [Enterococcus devriesei]|uniref:N-acetylglucosamine kinase n=1 Tax=Enterococcus devriesei TaxID=319970 RepID=UPI0036D3A7E0
MRFKIGIDSGGTHVTAEAYDSTGELLAESSAGPGNSLIDFELTKQNIKSVLTKLFKGLSVDDCELILAGIAGSQSAGNQKELAAFIENSFHCPATVISDAELARLKGLNGSDGILTIAGTGSIVLGQFNNRSYRAGGWGHLLGDYGSGYSLVRKVFKAMLEETDRGKSGEMTRLIMDTFETNDVYEAVRLFNRLPRNELAFYAKKLVEQGEKNSTFQTIMKTSGRELAMQVLAVLEQVGAFANQSKIAITGSVLTHNLVIRNSFQQTIKQNYPDVTFVPLIGSNAAGVIYYKGV